MKIGILTITILSMWVHDLLAEELKDIKGPVDYPSSLGWILASFAFLLSTAALVALIRYFIKHRSVKGERVFSAWEIATEALRKLAEEELLQKGEIETYFSRLSQIIRCYFEDRFQINAPDMTTEEFLVHLQSLDQLQDAHKELLKEFLVECDMVKFAKYSPKVTQADKAFQLAQNLIYETRQATETSPDNNTGQHGI